jgi:hypothetical protein
MTLANEWIPVIYNEKVRAQRTRAFHFEIPTKENHPEILHTLLGIELKVAKRRFACPDLPTARYLRVFARIGCRDIAVPYDITKISVIADELETAWHRMLLLFDNITERSEPSAKKRSRTQLIRSIRQEIDSIGPGEAMPAFDRPTRQRGL